MVTPEAVAAIQRVLVQSKADGSFAYGASYRRTRRQALAPLLTGRKLVETRDGRRFNGLWEVLHESGVASDSTRVLGRVRARPDSVRRWCDTLLNHRLDARARLAVVQGPRAVPHLSQNAFSLLLHLQDPSRFGVWNKQSETALRGLGLWPQRFPRGSGKGDRYLLINGILTELADGVGLTRYKAERIAVLDMLLWFFNESGGRLPRRKRPAANPPNDPDPIGLEGGRGMVTHLRTERSSRLAAQLKGLRQQEDPDLRCQVCGFSFLRAYGELGRGFIEAHHRELLSRRGKRPSGISDFEFVCSNCHRMLHRMPAGRMDTQKLSVLLKQGGRSRRAMGRS